MDWYSRIAIQESKAEKYYYYINCTSAKGDDVIAMKDMAVDVTYRTFMKHIDKTEIEYFGYAKDKRRGLTLKNDWHVRFSKSKYRECNCYFLTHSGIEYIYLKATDINKLSIDEW